jgi:hypothetical protein
VLGAILAPVAVSGADAADYRDVPRVTAVEPAFFRARLETARSDSVRIVVLGDSQETAPWGRGEQYIANLNARFAKVYGPSGETQLFTNHAVTTPPHWLGTMAEAAQSEPPSIPIDALPAGWVARGLRSGAGPSRTVFLHDASHCSFAGHLDGPWFDRNGPFVADILTVSRSAGGGIAWSCAPTDSNFPDAAAAVVQSGAFAANPKSVPGTFEWRTTPALSFAGKRHLQLLVEGSSAKSPADVVGVRFRSLSAHRGVTVVPFAEGGMRLVQVIADHGQSGAAMRAIAPSIVVLHYGANDSGNISSLEQWRSQLLSTIAWLRKELGDPALPIVIAAELRLNAEPQFVAIMDAMPVIAHEIASADPHVLALNLRRITAEEYGWGGSMRYMLDGAHFLDYAQRMLAEAFVGELTRALAIGDPACSQTNWADCIRVWGASCQLGGCRLEPDFEVAEHGLPWRGPGTDCSDLNGDGFSDQCPPGGREDLNHDGYINAADLTILLSYWGSAEPLADLDANGIVDAPDLAILLSRWDS